jgi:glycosyltransferase involved in cell wall biosynthesis
MGTPTVGPDIPSVREVFEDGQHLFLASQDGQDFCDIIIKLKKFPEIREKVAKKGRQFVLNNFTWKDNARRVLLHIHQARLGRNG